MVNYHLVFCPRYRRKIFLMTVIDTPSLPPECLTKHGKRNWQNSKQYKHLASQRRYLYSKQARLRIQQHQDLVIFYLAMAAAKDVAIRHFAVICRTALMR